MPVVHDSSAAILTNSSHNFDIEEGAQILFEGNVFEDCKAPMTEAALAVTSGLFNTPTSSDASKCSSALGRDCQVNSLSNSGDFGSFTDTAVVDAVGAADSIWEAMAADEVAAYVKANAGIGKLSDSSSSSTSTKSTSAESVEAADEDTSSSSAAPAATSSEAPASTSSAAAVETAASSSSSSSGSAVARYGQCGGQSYTGSTSCADGSTCTVQNDCEIFCC